MDKIEYEFRVVSKMIGIYCRHKHITRNGLCDECNDLRQYARERLNTCTFGSSKTPCEKCRVHCYNKKYRSKIKEVMRFACPRMIFYYPLDALRHFFL